MRVRIQESRHHERAAQILDFSAPSGKAQHLGVAACREHAAVLDRQRGGNPAFSVADPYGRAGIDPVGRVGLPFVATHSASSFPAPTGRTRQDDSGSDAPLEG